MKKLYTTLLVAYFIIPSISLAAIDTNLKYGARGAAVTELQDFLISKGFLTGQTSGNFFSLTRKAVVAYQTSVGLPATGYVGTMTRAKINDDLSATNAPAVSAEIAETGTIATQTNQATPLASGCTSTSGFSTTTGQSCSAITTTILPSGCSSMVGFSSTTGQSCLNVATSATANKTVTLATGAVVEIDALGNIVRTITPAPEQSSSTSVQQQISQIQNSLNQIVQNTTPQPYFPPVAQIKKELKVYKENYYTDNNIGSFDVIASYSENGLDVENIPITITSDESGVFYNDSHTSTSTRTISGVTHSFIKSVLTGERITGIRFRYTPITTQVGSYSIRATANGITAQTSGSAQLTEQQIAVLNFNATVETNKDVIANDGIDTIIVTIKTRNRDGSVLPNKKMLLRLGTSFSDIISDENGLVTKSLTTHEGTTGLYLSVYAEGKTFGKEIKIINTK